MTEQIVNLIKSVARDEYAKALEWTRQNQAIASSASPEERAASIAADAVMFKTGMHEYAQFQSHIGNMDVSTWLLQGAQ